MSDTISRKAAIDAFYIQADDDGWWTGTVQDMEEFLKGLPSAQPERAMKDCRNCKHGNYNDHWGTYFCYHSGDCNDWDKWEPSAQPEIVHCRECKYAEVADIEDGQDGYTCQFHRGSIWFSGSYCSWAERRR